MYWRFSARRRRASLHPPLDSCARLPFYRFLTCHDLFAYTVLTYTVLTLSSEPNIRHFRLWGYLYHSQGGMR